METEPQAIQLTWNKLTKSTLPAEIELYETTSNLNGSNFHAWYAIGDLSTGKVEVRVHIPSSPATIDTQSASFNGDCYLLVNGGYFYNGNHTGIAVINSIKSGSVSAVRGSLKTGDTEYNSMYNVTRGTFGVDASGKPNVVWTGTDASSNVFYFDRPLPSVKGENKYGIVTNENPTTAISWSPKYALSAGPVLLKDKKIPFDFTETSKGTDYYLSNYEIIPYDIFGANVTPDRTAIGYREDGKVVIFICDGRITASGGATLTELAQIMKGLGCVGAINLDGGGSTGMVVGDEHLNDMPEETGQSFLQLDSSRKISPIRIFIKAIAIYIVSFFLCILHCFYKQPFIMKKHIIILLITFLCLPEYLEAQLKYYDAAEFPLYGKATKNTENRDKHPRTPIIFIEDPVFAHALFDKKIAIEINKKNKAVNSVFKSLKTNKEVLK